MEDLRSTQLVIPMNYSKEDVKVYVKQHWNVTFARQKKVSIYAKRIMAKVLTMIRDNDKDFQPYYQFYATDVATEGEANTAIYRNVKSAFDELTDLKWLIENIEKTRFAYRHFLNTSDINCGYKDGVITIVLNPILKEFFIEMSQYSIYEIKHYMTFKSWYSMRLFEILSAYKETGVWWVKIEDYRELMDCKDKYDNTTLLLQYTLKEPLIELAKTECAFEYKPIYADLKQGRGRKRVVALEFKLKKVALVKIPKEWYDLSPAHAKLLDILLNKYKVTEKNITTYVNYIGIDGAKKLIADWVKKDNSERKIDDKVKYCNAAWVRQGKLQKELKEAKK